MFNFEWVMVSSKNSSVFTLGSCHHTWWLALFLGTRPKMMFVFIVSWASFGSLPKLPPGPKKCRFPKGFSKGVRGKIDGRMNSLRIGALEVWKLCGNWPPRQKQLQKKTWSWGTFLQHFQPPPKIPFVQLQDKKGINIYECEIGTVHW